MKNALAYLCLIPFLTACGATKLVEVPVPVEVTRYESLPVPEDLTIEVPPSEIPDALTYGQAIGLWADDRATIEILNARLKAIRNLK